jgi:hypothetical protein
MYMYISTYMYIGVYACAYENIMYEYILVHIYNIYIYIYTSIYIIHTPPVHVSVSVFFSIYTFLGKQSTHAQMPGVSMVDSLRVRRIIIFFFKSVSV